MKRRKFLAKVPLAASALMLGGTATNLLAATQKDKDVNLKKKLLLTVAHITDVHLPADPKVMERFVKCLKEVKTKKVDFFLNTGDSIMAVDRDNSTRQEVYDQWNAWDNCIKEIADYDMYSCVGNHDIWWAGGKSDEMYGVPYAAKRLKMPNRYYSTRKGKWHFIMLDGNNSGVTLDPEQMNWLKQELENIPQGEYALIMSHYPILTVTGTFEGGQHKDHVALKDLFYKHKDKVKGCLSGHQHLLDRAWYNDVYYFCNGAMSGFWWGEGDKRSAKPFYYQETPPGYAILKFYDDGTFENEYIVHHY